MGEVYLAYAHDLNREVAIKRMLAGAAQNADLRQLFLREVTVAASLEHHNVVETLDAGRDGETIFLVMELVNGPSLAEIMRVLQKDNKILPVELSCSLVAEIAQGLAHAHERTRSDGSSMGIVHRDIAPENILLSPEGVPKILDFGLATLNSKDSGQPGVIRGRIHSIAPEQARGEAVDARTDVFALGVMLFELTSGQPLYEKEALASLLWKVASAEYGDLKARLSHLEPDLVAIIERALAPKPEDRYPSARQLARALNNYRAARGLPASQSDVVRAISLTWPAIAAMREQSQAALGPGELEGQQLVLPPEFRRQSTSTAGVQNAKLLSLSEASEYRKKQAAPSPWDDSALPLPELKPEPRSYAGLIWTSYALLVLGLSLATVLWLFQESGIAF